MVRRLGHGDRLLGNFDPHMIEFKLPGLNGSRSENSTDTGFDTLWLRSVVLGNKLDGETKRETPEETEQWIPAGRAPSGPLRLPLAIPSEAGCACPIANRFARQVGQSYDQQARLWQELLYLHSRRAAPWPRSRWLPLPCAAKCNCTCNYTRTCVYQKPLLGLGPGLGKTQAFLPRIL